MSYDVKKLFSIGPLTVFYWPKSWALAAYRGAYGEMYIDIGPIELTFDRCHRA